MILTVDWWNLPEGGGLPRSPRNATSLRKSVDDAAVEQFTTIAAGHRDGDRLGRIRQETDRPVAKCPVRALEVETPKVVRVAAAWAVDLARPVYAGVYAPAIKRIQLVHEQQAVVIAHGPPSPEHVLRGRPLAEHERVAGAVADVRQADPRPADVEDAVGPPRELYVRVVVVARDAQVAGEVAIARGRLGREPEVRGAIERRHGFVVVSEDTTRRGLVERPNQFLQV